MRRTFLTSGTLMLFCAATSAQDSARVSFERWKTGYMRDFITDTHSPLRVADTGNVRFFPFNSKEVRRTLFIRAVTADTVTMATHDGASKRFTVYGVAVRSTPRKPVMRLTLYRSVRAGADSNLLFLPFYDATNGSTTYGGGRYMDIHISEITNGTLTIDFNRAYNPWCAYKDGYSCPVPPLENSLNVAVKAGEMLPANYDKEQ